MPKSSSGQAAILVFILLVVGLAIALSLGNRTLQDLQTSGTSDFSSRAYTAAEAGAEQALKTSLSTLTGGSSTYTSPVATFSGSGQSLASYTYTVTPKSTVAMTVPQDSTIQIPLKGGATYYSGVIKILWVNISDNLSGTTGENVAGSRPSIEVTLVKPAGGCGSSCDLYVFKGAFNSDTLRTNYFVTPSASGTVNYTLPGTGVNVALSVPNYSGGIGDTDANGNTTVFNQIYADKLTMTIPNSENYSNLRIRSVYNKVSVAVETGNVASRDLPTQSYVITSYGVAGNAKRAVQVTKSVPGYPSIFDYVLFNGSTTSVGK